jgi:hypothetical protein
VKSNSGEPFHLVLSDEHITFMFEADTVRAAGLVALHSKGFNSRALTELARLPLL